MPTARAQDGTRLYHEVTGDPGDPVVLLVMGLGLRGAIWGETRDVLTNAGFCAVTMDNRGIGASDASSGGYTTTAMAADAMAVLDAVGAAHAHVVGTSLGGMVAQEIALGYPQRVGALVLQSTTAGLPRIDFVPPLAPLRWARLAHARRRGDSPEQLARVALRLGTSSRFARTVDVEDRRVRLYLDELAAGVSPVAYAAQVQAATRHHAWGRLGAIRAPTLVQHGGRDRVVRAAAARAIAARIPGAQLEIFRGAGHFLALQRPDSLQHLLAFLRAHEHATMVASGPAPTLAAGEPTGAAR